MENNGNAEPGKSFQDVYLVSRTAYYVVSAILIILGFFIFFQICCTQSTGSDPSGFAGSSATSSGSPDGETNPYSVGVGEFVGILFIIGGIYWMAYLITKGSDTKKLVESGQFLGAVAISGKNKGEPPAELIEKQINVLEEYANARGIDIDYINMQDEEEGGDIEEEEYEEEYEDEEEE